MKSHFNGKRAGFTLIELLVSMAVLSVGTAALFALQGYVARSNMTSKEMTIATSIAENWVERLKMDALNWRAPGTPEINLVTTGYLMRINDAENVWRAPLLGNNYNARFGHSPASDLTGNEISTWPPPAGTAIGFCTNLRFNWVTPGTVMRVDVRVFWPRLSSGAVIANDFPLCDNPAGLLDVGPDGAADGVDDYHAVHTSTLLRWTPTPT